MSDYLDYLTNAEKQWFASSGLLDQYRSIPMPDLSPEMVRQLELLEQSLAEAAGPYRTPGVSASSRPHPKADLKEGLRSGRKPDITHVRTPLLNYVARACEYGSDKYERANYLRSAGETQADDFKRLRQYLRAAQSHLGAVLDAMELHQANDSDLTDTGGMATAAYCADTDEMPGAKVGASKLPHLAHAAASLMMAITQATTYGILPADPGTPWRTA